jgi:hypothetical protein
MDQSTIQLFRQLRPDYAGSSDEEIASVLTLPEPQNSVTEGEFVKGLNRGLGATAGGLQAFGGQLIEPFAPETGRELIDAGLSRARTAAQRHTGNVAEFTDIRGVGDALDWAAGTMGELVPTAATALAGGGVGGLALRGSARAALEAAAARGASKEALAALANQQARRSAFAGSAVGLFPQEAGEAALGLNADPEALANTAPWERVGLMGAKGATNAVLESVVPNMVMGRFIKPSAIAPGTAMQHLGGQVGKGMLAEGATEATQALTGDITQHVANPNHEWLDPKGMLNAAAAGAIGGGAMGSVGAIPGMVTRRTDNLPGSAKAGTAAGEAAEAAFGRGPKPRTSDPDFLMVSNPLPATASDEELSAAATQRTQAAENYANKLFDKLDATPAEQELAGQLIGSLSKATDDAARDAATVKFRDDFIALQGRQEAKQGFLSGLKNFITGTERRGNAQGESRSNHETPRLFDPSLMSSPTDFGSEADTLIRDPLGISARESQHVPSVKEHAVRTAQSWVKRNAQLTEIFPGLDVNDADLRNGAEALFHWVVGGMHNFDRVSNAVVQMWGKNTPEMVKSAYAAALSEGLVDPQDQRPLQAIEKLTASATKGQSRIAQLGKMVRETMLDNLTTTDIAAWHNSLNDYADGKDVGDLKAFRAALERDFGGNADEVVALYDRTSEEVLDFDKGAQNPDAEESDSGVEQEAGDWNKSLQIEQGTTVVHGNGKVGFDTHYDNAKDALLNLKHSLTGQGAQVVEVGAWTKLKRDFAESPEALRVQEDALLEKYGKHWSVQQFASRPGKLGAINRRVRWLIETQRLDTEAVDLTPKDIAAMKDSKGGPETGRIVLERLVEDRTTSKTDPETGEVSFGTKPQEFYVSVGNIIKVMRQKRDQGAFDVQDENAAANAHRLLMSGLSSLMNVEGFTGKMGTLQGGKVAWGDTLPDALYDPYTKLSFGVMRAAYDAGIPRNDAERRTWLEDKVVELQQKVSAITAVGDGKQMNTAQKLAGLAEKISKVLEDGDLKALNRQYRELQGMEVRGDQPESSDKSSKRDDVTPSEVDGIEKINRDAHGNSLGFEPDPRQLFDSNDTEVMTKDARATLDALSTGEKNNVAAVDERTAGVADQGADLQAGQPGPADASQRNNLRNADASVTQQGASGVPAGGGTTRAQLAQYLPLAEAKNKPLAGAIRRAIVELDAGKTENGNHRGALVAARKQFGEVGAGETAKNLNSQTPSRKPITDEQKAATIAEIVRLVGDKVKVEFLKFVKSPDGKKWSGDQSERLIRISMFAQDPLGTGRHEALHQLMQWLSDAGAHNAVEVLKNASTNKLVMTQLRHQLQDHPDALKQLENPVEAAAYLYQFWQAKLVDLGPKAETFFQKVENLIRKVLNLVTQEVRDAQHAEEILQAFDNGAFAKEPSVAAKIIEEKIALQRDAYGKNVITALMDNKTLKNWVFTAGDVLRDTKKPSLIKLADMLYTPATGELRKQSYFDAVPQQRALWLNKLNKIFFEADKGDVALALKHLQAETPDLGVHDPVVRKLVTEVRDYLDEMYSYMKARNVQRFNEETGRWEPVPKITRHYFPRIWDTAEIAKDPAVLAALLVKHHANNLKIIAKEHNVTEQQVAEAIVQRLLSSHGAPEITESTTALGITPYQQSVNKRSLNWIDPKIFEPFMSKDISHIMTGYTVQAVKRAEYTSRFGPEGEVIQDMLDEALADELYGKDSVKQLAAGRASLKALKDAWRKDGSAETKKPTMMQAFIGMAGEDRVLAARATLNEAAKVITAAEGTIGRDIDARLQTIYGGVSTYQSLRLLSLSLFSSFIDPLGMIVRGGSLDDAWQGFVRGIKEVKLGWQGKYSNDEMAQLAERLGTVDAGTFMDALGQTYASIHMYGRMRRFNDAIFKWNGMEAWNRAMRIQATGAAIGFIERHLTKPAEHSARYLKDELGLRGTGYLKDGKLDVENLEVQHAIVRWVNGSILRPNAMQRPIMASDPHYAILYHLKQFAYSFHKTILERSVNELRHGNYTPVTALFVAYVPMMVAADVVKELLRPGDDPAWMKMGLGEYVRHGLDRANLMGIPQFGYDAITSPGKAFENPAMATSKAAGLFGPTVQQLVDWALVPLSEDKTLGGQTMRSLPLQTIYRDMGDWVK